MAVIGLLLGASVMTSRMLEERRQIKMEMERLQRVSDAIIGYALRNRTRERVIKFVTRELPHAEWAFRLPAGRPYLPCPDSDGDGYEDRWPNGANGFAQGVEIKPDLTVTATIGVIRRPFTSPPLTWIAPDESGEWEEWLPYGECRVAKGAVPWRTLGVEPSDGWGNRHTYFADIVFFPNAIFGFDRQTVADRYDLRVPAAPDTNLSRRVRAFLGHCPASICDGGRSKGFACARYSGFCIWGGGGPDFDRINPDLVFKAGGIAEERILPSLSSSRSRYFAAGAVIDGLPFVLLSHGPNGRFAVNHWATLSDPVDDLGFTRPICNSFAWAEDAGFDAPPADYYAVNTENLALLYEGLNGKRALNGTGCPSLIGDITDGDALALGLGFNPSFFVWQPPAIGDRSDFDDLLLWKTREELTAVIRGRIPRLPHMAIPYFPE